MPRNGENSTHEVYNQNAKKTRWRRRKTFPLAVYSHFIKSIIDKVWSSINTLTQFTRVYKKECFKAWFDRSISLNALSFLSFHKVHIKHIGTTLQAFSLLLPTKAPCQPNKFLLIEECKTHYTSKREKIKLQSIVAFLQNKIKWSLVSSFSLHK